MSQKILWIFALAVLALLWLFRGVIFFQPVSSVQIQAELLPYYQIKTPSSPGPHPAVLLFHGCAGPEAGPAKARMDWFVELGYVAIAVDSYTGRGYSWSDVCLGMNWTGSQRAADINAALQYARGLTEVDKNNLYLVGYSHGAWAILEALFFGNKLPPSVVDTPPYAPQNLFAGVKAIAAYYPYCGDGARYIDGYPSDIPLLMLLAENDNVISTPACLDFINRNKTSGNIQWQVLADVGHVFDVPTRRGNYDESAAKSAQKTLARHFASRYQPSL